MNILLLVLCLSLIEASVQNKPEILASDPSPWGGTGIVGKAQNNEGVCFFQNDVDTYDENYVLNIDQNCNIIYIQNCTIPGQINIGIGRDLTKSYSPLIAIYDSFLGQVSIDVDGHNGISVHDTIFTKPLSVKATDNNIVFENGIFLDSFQVTTTTGSIVLTQGLYPSVHTELELSSDEGDVEAETGNLIGLFYYTSPPTKHSIHIGFWGLPDGVNQAVVHSKRGRIKWEYSGNLAKSIDVYDGKGELRVEGFDEVNGLSSTFYGAAPSLMRLDGLNRDENTVYTVALVISGPNTLASKEAVKYITFSIDDKNNAVLSCKNKSSNTGPFSNGLCVAFVILPARDITVDTIPQDEVSLVISSPMVDLSELVSTRLKNLKLENVKELKMDGLMAEHINISSSDDIGGSWWDTSDGKCHLNTKRLYALKSLTLEDKCLETTWDGSFVRTKSNPDMTPRVVSSVSGGTADNFTTNMVVGTSRSFPKPNDGDSLIIDRLSEGGDGGHLYIVEVGGSSDNTNAFTFSEHYEHNQFHNEDETETDHLVSQSDLDVLYVPSLKGVSLSWNGYSKCYINSVGPLNRISSSGETYTENIKCAVFSGYSIVADEVDCDVISVTGRMVGGVPDKISVEIHSPMFSVHSPHARAGMVQPAYEFTLINTDKPPTSASYYTPSQQRMESPRVHATTPFMVGEGETNNLIVGPEIVLLLRRDVSDVAPPVVTAPQRELQYYIDLSNISKKKLVVMCCLLLLFVIGHAIVRGVMVSRPMIDGSVSSTKNPEKANGKGTTTFAEFSSDEALPIDENGGLLDGLEDS